MSTTATTARRDRALWVQCACTALVALGAAYASYRHGREFALRYGADEATAAIWPLIVDGLLTTATVELWKTTGHGRRPVGGMAGLRVRNLPLAMRERRGGSGVERVRRGGGRMSATRAAAGGRAAQPRAQATPRRDRERVQQRDHRDSRAHPDETAHVARLVAVPPNSRPSAEPTAERRMWAHYVTERSKGRTPTGAELDRIAGTNNYGRRVLRRWRNKGLTENSPASVDRAVASARA